MNAPVCGITPPRTAPAPRDPATVAAELGRAADHLRHIAGSLATGITGDLITEAATATVGIGRLLVELRQTKKP